MGVSLSLLVVSYKVNQPSTVVQFLTIITVSIFIGMIQYVKTILFNKIANTD